MRIRIFENKKGNQEYNLRRMEAQEKEIKELKQYMDQLEKEIVYYKEKLKITKISDDTKL